MACVLLRDVSKMSRGKGKSEPPVVMQFGKQMKYNLLFLRKLAEIHDILEVPQINGLVNINFEVNVFSRAG